MIQILMNIACGLWSGGLVICILGIAKNQWTFNHMNKLNLDLYSMSLCKKISHEEFMKAHTMFPNYDKIAEDLLNWTWTLPKELDNIIKRA